MNGHSSFDECLSVVDERSFTDDEYRMSRKADFYGANAVDFAEQRFTFSVGHLGAIPAAYGIGPSEGRSLRQCGTLRQFRPEDYILAACYDAVFILFRIFAAQSNARTSK